MVQNELIFIIKQILKDKFEKAKKSTKNIFEKTTSTKLLHTLAFSMTFIKLVMENYLQPSSVRNSTTLLLQAMS